MEKLAVVSSSPLFEMLSSVELARLAELAEPRRYPAGGVVFEEGELGDSLYLLVHGEVEVRRREGADSHVLTVLGAPAFFGEMSVIDHELEPISDQANLHAVSRYFATYNLVNAPVVDRENRLIGAITVDDVLDHVLPEDWRGDQLDAHGDEPAEPAEPGLDIAVSAATIDPHERGD